MKRKLSALIAIVLVAVMVFPTALFVSADETPTPTPPENPKIEKFTVSVTDMEGKKVTDSTISIPVGGYVDVTVDTDAGVEVTFEMSDTAVATESAITGGKRYTGRYANEKGTLTITATKTGEAGTTPDTKTYTLNISCIPVAVAGELEFSITPHDFDPTDPVSKNMITVSGKLNNGTSVDAEVTGVALNKTDKYTDSVSVKGGDDTIYFQYNIKNSDYTVTGAEGSVGITVKAQKITNMSITLPKEKPFNTTDNITPDALKSKIELRVTVENMGTLQPSSSDYTLELYKTGVETPLSSISYADYAIYKNDYSIKITYSGADKTFALTSLGDLYNEEVPHSFKLDLSGVKNKSYIDGQTISDFSGATLKVYDEDNKEITLYSCNGTEISKLDLTLTPFRYGDKTIEATLTIGGTTLPTTSVSVANFTITKKQVTDIKESKKSTMKKTYTVGDKLDLSGLTFTLTYNSGETEDIPYNNSQITCNPKNGDELTSTSKSILVYYSDPNTGFGIDTMVTLTINPKAAESKKISEVKLLSSYNAKRDYFIGETFDPDGFEFLIVYSDGKTEVKDLGSYTVTVDSTKYDTSKKQFTAAMNGDLKVKFTIKYNNQNYTVSLTLTDISVTKRPTLESIVASAKKTSFMDGDSLRVCDFVITAKYDDKTQRVFEIDEETTGATKSSYSVTQDDVYYTVKLNPTVIDSDTKTVRVTYSERPSGKTTTTKYDDVEIEVTIPDAILTYYDNSTSVKAYVTKAYEDFDDALEAAEYAAKNYTSSSYYYSSSRIPEVQLRRDVTMTSDFPTTEDLIIDLNGHSLTMIRGELYVSSKATSGTEVTFTNTAKDDGKLINSTSDDDTIIISEDETFTIDRSSGADVGKYDVTITSVKNGAVTGPREVTHGHDAKFTLTPDDDYKVKSISVKEGKNTKKYTEKDGVVTIEDVQGELTITVTFEEKAWENPFTDVYKSATYYKSIQFVYENGLFSGMSTTKFEPDTQMTRAMFVTVLGRLADIDTTRYGKTSTFPDVSSFDASISYAIPYITWATENGLIKGYEDGNFKPKENITHIQMYVMMQRYASYIEHLNTSATTTTIPANDVTDIPSWDGAYEAVQYAAKNDFLVKSSNRITPNGEAKRSELAVLLHKFAVNVLDWDD